MIGGKMISERLRFANGRQCIDESDSTVSNSLASFAAFLLTFDELAGDSSFL
ncbi:hypothetical protein RMSM_04054 [Rhodopirellula maiorica SM1]|uniref:Uncharacterized protein n=1 Tax=Rhodopirellula maiorica SM1 TaxID=1265738 RepID=M5RIK4_9BACT|nr:hypothetical protein RMSM_04054 [Rhodopirellula maiorica SM1]